MTDSQRRHWLQRQSAMAAAVALVPAAGLLSAADARAQTPAWPSRPVRIVVAFPPGGVADIWARAIAPSLQELLGQPVVVENRSGANGNVAAESVAKASPDGHTLLLCSTGIDTVNPLIMPKGGFDVTRDLLPVSLLGSIKLYLITRPGLPPSSLKEFITYARANVGKLTYGSAGSGSTPHLAGELFKQQAGVFATHIPYRGAAPALQDLLAGQIDFFFDPGIAFTHVRTGRVKMLGVASATRSLFFPDVPTMAEAGVPGVEADTLFGLWAPAGTPAEVVNRLNREVNKVLAQPPVKQRFANVGGETLPVSIAEFKDKIRAEGTIFGGVIKSRKIQAD